MQGYVQLAKTSEFVCISLFFIGFFARQAELESQPVHRGKIGLYLVIILGLLVVLMFNLFWKPGTSYRARAWIMFFVYWGLQSHSFIVFAVRKLYIIWQWKPKHQSI